MEKVDVENRISLHGSAGAVVELFDNWEGMRLASIRIGCHNSDGTIGWSCDEIALGWDMVRGLGAQLTKMADEHDTAQ